MISVPKSHFKLIGGVLAFNISAGIASEAIITANYKPGRLATLAEAFCDDFADLQAKASVFDFAPHWKVHMPGSPRRLAHLWRVFPFPTFGKFGHGYPYEG